MHLLVILSLVLWIIIFLLPWRPWSTREQWNATPNGIREDLSMITVLIPARNESRVIERTLTSVASQGNNLSIIVVDDRSEDDTAEVASKVKGQISVLNGKPRPEGWTGKLWALEQGLAKVETPYTLLLDADIELNKGVIAGLYKKMQRKAWDGVSLMAAPTLVNSWEKLLMPAFIYFFKLLYPFQLANSKFKWVAAAAGGCFLVKTQVLKDIGGFGPMKSAVIDDCTLARKIKDRGYRTWVGLTRSIQSVRPYEGLEAIWNMVARTAYTQLLYSIPLLLLCSFLLILAFWIPIAGLFLWGSTLHVSFAFSTLLIMSITYLPVLIYYRLPAYWSFTLPFTGTLYLLMTWTSAIRFWKGERLRWRGRMIKVDEVV